MLHVGFIKVANESGEAPYSATQSQPEAGHPSELCGSCNGNWQLRHADSFPAQQKQIALFNNESLHLPCLVTLIKVH